MNHISKFQSIILALILIGLHSCSTIKEPELSSIEIVELSRTAGEGVLKVELTFLNSNSKPITVKKADIDGMINQKSIGKYTLPSRSKIKKNSRETVEVVYDFEPDNIYAGFLSNQFGAIGSKRVRISLNGQVVFVHEDKELTVPVEYSEVYKIPD